MRVYPSDIVVIASMSVFVQEGSAFSSTPVLSRSVPATVCVIAERIVVSLAYVANVLVYVIANVVRDSDVLPVQDSSSRTQAFQELMHWKA